MRAHRLGCSRGKLRGDDLDDDQLGRERRHKPPLVPRAAPRLCAAREPGYSRGMTITASEYLTIQRARHRIREALRATYERVDIIASPTTARVAPLLTDGVKGNGDDTRHASYNHSNLLRFPSMLGLPGCSLPCGFNAEGMPIGMQLIGNWFTDQTVLNTAFAYERTTDWHTRRPALVRT